MKKGLEKGDLLIFKSLGRFARSYEDIMKQWKDGEIKGVEAIQMLKITKAICYRRVKEYEDR